MKNTWRLALVALVAIALAACSKPQPPTLSQLAGDTAALSSFVALAGELEIDLNAVVSGGQFTVFAPSNDLLDEYADAFGFADAAAMVTALETAPATLRTAVTLFVASHIVDYQPGLLTEAFITSDITETDEWYMFYCFAGDCDGFFHLYWYSGYDTPANAYHELYFYGDASTVGDSANVYLYYRELDFLAADVPFSNGIVHVMDGTIMFGNLSYFD